MRASPPEQNAHRSPVWPLLAFGLQAWALIVVAPRAVLHLWAREDAPLVALPVAILVLGLRALANLHPHGARRRAALAWFTGACLLVLFPSAIAVSTASRSELRSGDAFGIAGLAVGALAFAVYLVFVLDVLSRRASPEWSTIAAPLDPSTQRPTPKHRPIARAVLTALFAAASFVYVAVLPFVAPGSARQDAWKDATAEGLVLTTWIATAIGTASMALFLGTGLRAERRTAIPLQQRAIRVSILCAVAAMGAIAWLAYRRS